MYIQIPGYDDCQCYDLGADVILSRIARKIYANFHKAMMGNFETSLVYGEIPKKLFKELSDVAGNDKQAYFKQGRLFGRVETIPIASTSDELVGMVFAGYGDFPAFLHTRGTFSRFPTIILWRRQDRRTNGRNGAVEAISNWSAVFGRLEL